MTLATQPLATQLKADNNAPVVTNQPGVGHFGGGLKFIFTGPSGLRAGWRLLIFAVLIVGLIGGMLIIGNGGVEGFKQAQRNEGQTIVTPLIMGRSTGIAFLLICVATWIMSRIEHRGFGEYGLRLRPAFRRDFWFGGMSGFLALSAALLSMFLLHGFRITGLALSGTAILSSMLAWGLAFIAAGLCEEFLMRGYAQCTLASGIGFWPAAFISSTLFAFGHAFNAHETFVGVAAVVFFGLLHCLLLQRTGSLWMAIGFHAGWDWGQTCFYGVPDSGIVPYYSVFHSAANGPAWLSGGIVGPEASIFCPIALLAVAVIFSHFYRQRLYKTQMRHSPQTASPQS